MKRGLVVLAFLVVAAATIVAAPMPGAGKTIGVSHFWLGNDWNLYIKDAMVPYLESRGYKVSVSNAMGVTDQQKADVENFIASKVSGLVIAGGEAGAFMDLSLKAKAAGIPLVTIDMVLPGAVASVSADNYGGGTQLGLFVVKQLKGVGKVIILDSPGWKSILIRGDMMKAVLGDYAGIKIVGSYEINAADPVNSAYSTVKSALKSNPDIKAIISTWGMPSLGANQAVTELGLAKQIVIAEADSDKAILEAMGAKGAPVWGMLGQNSGVLGKNAAVLLDNALTNGPNTVSFAEWGPTYIVTNIDINAAFSRLEYVDKATMWSIAYGDKDNPFKK